MSGASARASLAIAGLSIASGLVLGLTTVALGIYAGPIQEAYRVGAAEAARATTAYLLCMTFGAPLCGWLIDRFGAARVSVLGATGVAAGFLAAASAGGLGSYVAGMCVAGFGAGASTYVPSTLVIRSRFPQHAALALGAYLAAVALICAITPLIVAHLIASSGWRPTLRIVALAIAVVAVPLLARCARTPQPADAVAAQGEGSASGGAALGLLSRGFWLIASVQVLTGLGFQQLYNHIVPYLLSCGYAPERAAVIFGATNATSALGFFLFGLLADRIGPRRALVAGAIVCAAGTPLLLGADVPGMASVALPAFVLLWGATCSLSNQFVPLLLGSLVEERHFAALLGLSYVIYGMAGAAGPSITGLLVDRTHGYTAAVLLAALWMLLSVLPVLSLGRTRRA